MEADSARDFMEVLIQRGQGRNSVLVQFCLFTRRGQQRDCFWVSSCWKPRDDHRLTRVNLERFWVSQAASPLCQEEKRRSLNDSWQIGSVCLCLLITRSFLHAEEEFELWYHPDCVAACWDHVPCLGESRGGVGVGLFKASEWSHTPPRVRLFRVNKLKASLAPVHQS